MNPTYDNAKALISGIKARFDDSTTYTQYDTVTILEILNERLAALENKHQPGAGESPEKPENRNFWSLVQLNTQYVDALHEIKAELQRGNYIRIGKIIRDALGEPEPEK